MTKKQELKAERNRQLRKRFVELRKVHSAGKCLDILAEEFKMQFDTVRSIVYKKLDKPGL